MFSAQPVAFEEAASLVVQQSQQSTTATATKHTLTTISPPDTPGAVDTLSARSSPTTFTPIVKRTRMDLRDELENSMPVQSNARLSVVANGLSSSSSSTSVNTSVKYDRQIRIWGDHGQSALQSGCVFILGHSMSACEVAKNLSLAGVGSLTFVDTGLLVTPEACTRQALPPLHGFENKPICDAMAHWTKLFNPSATISCLRLKNLDDLATYISQNEQSPSEKDSVFHKRPSCVIICNPAFVPSIELLVEKLLPVPVICCTTIGLMAYVRVCLPPVYPVVETHSEYALEDLRLTEPFPGLLKLFESINFDELSPHERRSVPWPLVVLHFVHKLFPNFRNGAALSSSDRDVVKQRIREFSRQDALSEATEESENYQQAVKGLNPALTAPIGIPSAVADILNDNNVDKSTEPFWIMCAGLRQFIASRASYKYPLPLRGSIPDISASTVRFVSLQDAYRRQADADASAVHHIVLSIAQERNVPPDSLPTFADVQLFCRNAAFLRVLRGVSLQNEDVLSGMDWSHCKQYLAMRAFDDFCSTNGRLPTKGDISSLLKKMPPNISDQSAFLSELISCAQSPEVCAPVMGGIISHEAVKLITGQFIPVNNALFFDGRTKSISSQMLVSGIHKDH